MILILGGNGAVAVAAAVFSGGPLARLSAADNEIGAGALLLGMYFVSPTRAKHFAAMVMIGDGVMALIDPARDANAWNHGPKIWRGLMDRLAKRPALTRAIGVAQIAGGIYWALKQEDPKR